MVITCQQCSARLQLDDSKIPARAFTVRCPKCQHVINAQPASDARPQPAGTGGGAFGLGETPSAHPARSSSSSSSRPVPAPAFRLDVAGGGAEQTAAAGGDAAQGQDAAALLMTLLQNALKTAGGDPSRGGSRLDLSHRHVLVCAAPDNRFGVARVLVENGYEAYVAEDTTQAIERMREKNLDVVLLDPTFDPQEQGAAFIRREIAALRPSARRRVFFVVLSAEVRSGDAHQAFLAHANLVVNPADLEDLPQLLERGLHDFGELYRDFNRVLQAAHF